MATQKIKVAFHTLGCKLNFAETSTLARSLDGEKYVRVDENQQADAYIINTCTVTEAADKKCRQTIRKFINRSPGALIIVTGCYAQVRPEEISGIEGVDLIIGNNEKFNLSRYLSESRKKEKAEIYACGEHSGSIFLPSYSSGDRTRSFLKVQDGCDYKCSYCTIPGARGKSRNPDIRSLLDEAGNLAAKGIKEIVLTGVNIGDFGKSSGESFTELVSALNKAGKVERIRLSSVEPNLITDDLIMTVAASTRIMPHFHIPLQSGSDKILGLMKRRYRRKLFAERVEKIISLMPYAGIGADLITGFPGEDEQDYLDTIQFIKDLPLSYLHVFPFSERPGTVAARLGGKLPQAEKERRAKKLSEISGELHDRFVQKNIGREDNVLFETSRSGEWSTGFTGNYLKVYHPFNSSLKGTIKRVILTEVSADGHLHSKIID